MRPFLPSLLALPLAGPALAQAATPAPADTTHFYKHHLGLTASPVLDHFFTANRSLPVGLLYKHQTKPGRLLRLGLQFNPYLNYRLDPYSSTYSPYTNNTLRISAAAIIGREYYQILSKRWTLTAGVDFRAGYSYERIYSEGAGDNISGETTYKERTDLANTYQLAMSPFLGFRYFFSKTLYTSVEANISINYNRIIYTTDGYTIGLITNTRYDVIRGNTRYNIADLVFRPIKQLTLHYLL